MAKHFEFKSIVFTFLLSCAMWTVLFVACNDLSGKYEEPKHVKDSTNHTAELYGSYDEVYWFKIGDLPIKRRVYEKYTVVCRGDVLYSNSK